MNNTIIEYINGMEVVKVFNKDADSYEPVSYTHLDVYKRQPKAPRKPRKTKKQKIQEIVKLAMKNGMSVEEIAGQLHVEVES